MQHPGWDRGEQWFKTEKPLPSGLTALGRWFHSSKGWCFLCVFCLQGNFKWSWVSDPPLELFLVVPLVASGYPYMFFLSPNQVWWPGWNSAGCVGGRREGRGAGVGAKFDVWTRKLQGPGVLILFSLGCFRLEKGWRPGWWVKPVFLLLSTSHLSIPVTCSD